MRYTWMGLIGWLLAGMMTVSAESAAVEGLGKFPFGSRVEVTAGPESSVENFFCGKDRASRQAMGKIICKSAVPPGVHLHTEEGTFPYDSLRMYQLRTDDMQGEYAAFLFVLSGEERELFPHRNKKVISFWNQAFYEDGKKPEFLFGIPKISLAEYQAEWEQFLQKEKIKDIKVKISDISPWHRYKNKDGSPDIFLYFPEPDSSSCAAALLSSSSRFHGIIPITSTPDCYAIHNSHGSPHHGQLHG